MKTNRQILLIGNHLNNSGQNIVVGETLAQKLAQQGWGVILTSSHVNKIFRITDMLSTILLKRCEYDVAHIDVFSGPAFIWAYLSGFLLRSLNKPFILTLHGGNLPAFSEKHPKRVAQLLHWASIVTSPSNYLIQHLKAYRNDIKLIPNAIEMSAYPFWPRTALSPNIIWLRAFHRIYNPSLLPRVVSILNLKDISARVTMIGPDKGDGSLQEMQLRAQELDIQKQIYIIPGIPKTQVPEELSKGDIFINSTNIESFGVSVLEAAACGLCIITTNVGELPNIWPHEQDALLVPPNDPQAMADAVARILTEPGLGARLSTNARKKAEQFDWSVILPQWEHLLNSIS